MNSLTCDLACTSKIPREIARHKNVVFLSPSFLNEKIPEMSRDLLSRQGTGVLRIVTRSNCTIQHERPPPPPFPPLFEIQQEQKFYYIFFYHFLFGSLQHIRLCSGVSMLVAMSGLKRLFTFFNCCKFFQLTAR